MGLPFSAIVKYVMGGFNPLSWFSKGEPGAWYDPSDFQPNWRRNLLTWSEDFSNAAWEKSTSTLYYNYVIAPDGTQTATLIGPTVSVTPYQQITWITGTTYVYSIYVRGITGATISFRMSGSNSISGDQYRTFTASTGNIVRVSGDASSIQTATPVGDGWYRLVMVSVADRNFTGYVSIENGNGFAVWHPQLEQSSSASTYQKITDGIQDYYTVQPQPVLFQDSAGTTPVTAVEQPVGLMLDKSKGLALGAELSNYFSGFSSLTGISGVNSTNTIVSNELVNTATNTIGSARSEIPIAGLVIGAIYNIEIVAKASNLASGPQFRSSTALNIPVTLLSTVATKYTFRVSASAVSGVIRIYSQDSTGLIGDTATITNISVKQIAGNHAFQATAGNRPVLSARVNLLTKTEDFSDAVTWSKAVGSSVTPNTSIAPDGTLTADTLVINSPTLGVYQTIASKSGTYIWSVWINGIAGVIVNVGSNSDAGSSQYKQITLTGAWQYITGLVSLTPATGNIYFHFRTDYPSTYAAYTCQAWHPDLRPTNSGALLPPYQRVNTASDYDTIGFPLYLKANGTSSAMSTNSIDFTATDKMTVVTGVRKLSDAVGYPVIAELSTSVSTLNGSFALFTLTATTGTYLSSLRGSTLTEYSMATFNAPISNVLSDSYNISGTDRATNIIPKINGATPTLTGLSGANAGTGNFGNYPLYLFARAGTSLYLNGQFYGAIIRGAQSDTASVTQTENYMATKTGITF